MRSTRRKPRRRRTRGSPTSISACRQAAAEADLQRRHLAAAQNEIGRLTAFWHYFKRRRRQKSLESLRSQVVVADAAVGDLHAERSAIDTRLRPNFPASRSAARRNINLAIISFAELLCEHVDAYGLAARAKEAVARRVHEMSFGTRADCEGYMQRVQKGTGRRGQSEAGHRSRSRPSWTGCAPPANTATMPTRFRPRTRWRPRPRDAELGKSAKPPAAAAWNVLAEDYWDLYTLLLR